MEQWPLVHFSCWNHTHECLTNSTLNSHPESLVGLPGNVQQLVRVPRPVTGALLALLTWQGTRSPGRGCTNAPVRVLTSPLPLRL